MKTKQNFNFISHLNPFDTEHQINQINEVIIAVKKNLQKNKQYKCYKCVINPSTGNSLTQTRLTSADPVSDCRKENQNTLKMKKSLNETMIINVNKNINYKKRSQSEQKQRNAHNISFKEQSDEIESNYSPSPINISRISGEQLMSIDSIVRKDLGQYINDNFQKLQDILKAKQHTKMVNEFLKMLMISQKANQFDKFYTLIYLMGDYCFDAQIFNQAIFFYSQALIMTQFTLNLYQRMNLFYQFAECSKKLKEYQIAIKLASRALQYSWYLQDKKFEWKCYDQLGQINFYLGDIEKSNLLHERYSKGVTQPQSFVKNQAYDCVLFFLKENPNKIDYFCNRILSQLSLPIKNLSSTRKYEVNRMDSFKLVKYDNCSGQQILRNMMQTTEFQLFNLDIEYLLKSDMENAPKIEFKNTHITTDGFKQNQYLNLEAQVNNRKQINHNFHEIIETIQQKVTSRQPIQGIQASSFKIYIRHLQMKQVFDAEKYISLLKKLIF